MRGKNIYSQKLNEITDKIAPKNSAIASELTKVAQMLDNMNMANPDVLPMGGQGPVPGSVTNPAVNNVADQDVIADPYNRETKNYGNAPEDIHVIEFEFKVPAGTDKDFVLAALKGALKDLESQNIEYVKATFKKKTKAVK